jgi:hypothetical protein
MDESKSTTLLIISWFLSGFYLSCFHAFFWLIYCFIIIPFYWVIGYATFKIF